MKSLRKKSVHSRKLTYLTAFTMVLALAGCSNTDDETPDLEETTDASVSDPVEYIPASEDGPAENVPEPRLTVEASETSVSGAQAALEYFWQGVDYMRLTGEAQHVQNVSGSECDLCADLIEGWSEVYQEGSWAALHGEMELDIHEINLSKLQESDRELAEISFTMTEPAADFYEKGTYLEEESYDKDSTAKWWAQLSFDATAQAWEIEWVGLESHLSEDEE